MSNNVEIKAKVQSLTSLENCVKDLCNEDPSEIFQEDIFFKCNNGRLKLRNSDLLSELIFYKRSDQTDPKKSFYLRSPVESPALIRKVLDQAYGEMGKVRKWRKIYLVEETRIHLDHVENLGDFMEIEVVLSDVEEFEKGVIKIHSLIEKLGIKNSQLIEASYIDLIRNFN